MAADHLVIHNHYKQRGGEGQDIDDQADRKNLQDDRIEAAQEIAKP